jgi:hypothetical protein
MPDRKLTFLGHFRTSDAVEEIVCETFSCARYCEGSESSATEKNLLAQTEQYRLPKSATVFNCSSPEAPVITRSHFPAVSFAITFFGLWGRDACDIGTCSAQINKTE